MNDEYWPTPEERERAQLERDPDFVYDQRCRTDRLCSKPVDPQCPDMDFPILAIDPDDIGPAPAPYTAPVELPF